jgi:hypothetical protein
VCALLVRGWMRREEPPRLTLTRWSHTHTLVPHPHAGWVPTPEQSTPQQPTGWRTTHGACVQSCAFVQVANVLSIYIVFTHAHAQAHTQTRLGTHTDTQHTDHRGPSDIAPTRALRSLERARALSRSLSLACPRSLPEHTLRAQGAQ